MSSQELLHIIQAGESETAEFKRSLGELREIVETVGAFANAHGGTVIIGVDRNSQIVGVEIGRDSLESLANTIQQNTDPKVLPSISMAIAQGKQVIVVKVSENPIKPVFVYHKPIKRVGRSNPVMTGTEVAHLAMEGYGLSWDAEPLAISLSEISDQAVKRFLQAARQERNFEIDPKIPVEEALEKLRLLRDGQPTRAALLLFGCESSESADTGAGPLCSFPRDRYLEVCRHASDRGYAHRSGSGGDALHPSEHSIER